MNNLIITSIRTIKSIFLINKWHKRAVNQTKIYLKSKMIPNKIQITIDKVHSKYSYKTSSATPQVAWNPTRGVIILLGSQGVPVIRISTILLLEYNLKPLSVSMVEID